MVRYYIKNEHFKQKFCSSSFLISDQTFVIDDIQNMILQMNNSKQASVPLSCTSWKKDLYLNTWLKVKLEVHRLKRRSTRPPNNLSGEESLIFDLTISKWRSCIMITKPKILAWSDRSSLSYGRCYNSTLRKSVIFRCFPCSVKFID